MGELFIGFYITGLFIWAAFTVAYQCTAGHQYSIWKMEFDFRRSMKLAGIDFFWVPIFIAVWPLTAIATIGFWLIDEAEHHNYKKNTIKD